MLQGIRDLFDLLTNVSKSLNLYEVLLNLLSVLNVCLFVQLILQLLHFNSLKISPSISEGAEVLEAMHNMLDYDSDVDASAAITLRVQFSSRF